MKAMLLAAGYGRRMQPLTELRAKPVLPVFNRPLLHWTLLHLAQAGVRDVVINVHHLASGVRAAVGDGREFGLRVHFSREDHILGTGGGPRRARHLLGDGPVLLVNGDILFDLDLAALLSRHRRSGAVATLALRPNPDPVRYPPVVTAAGGRVLSIGQSGAPGHGRLQSLFAGVHVLETALLERLPPGVSDSVQDLYRPLLAEGAKLVGLRPRGAWYDLGHPAEYRAVQATLAARGRWRSRAVHGEARVDPEARVRRSVVGAGCVIGPGARVSGSVLWEGVNVGSRAQVTDSVLTSGVRVAPGTVLESSILMPERSPLALDGSERRR